MKAVTEKFDFEKKIKPRDLKFDTVTIYYPDGELIVKSDSPLVIDDVRTQIYNSGIRGCYAICNGISHEIGGGNWPFNIQHKEILANLILAKNKFLKD